MKYMNGGGLPHSPLMRLTLGGTLVLLIGFWFSNALMYFARMGLDPSRWRAHVKTTKIPEAEQ